MRSLFLVFLFLTGFFNANGQTKNNPLYDYSKWIHFGFSIGTNISDFRYQLSDDFYKNDSLQTISVEKFPGISLGVITNIHMGEHWDLRFIPSLILNQRAIRYNFEDRPQVIKNVESVFIETPVHVKFKSVRHTNVRFYVIGGLNYAFDMASEEEAVQDPLKPIVALKPNNYNYEFGFGFDFYFPYFKFSPEIKLSRGLNNILVSGNHVYADSFDKLFSNFLYVSFHFE